MSTLLLTATLASIAALTALGWLLRRAVLPRLCPLCTGVAGTWIGLLAAHWAGVGLDLRLPALLLGGSVVGLAGLGEAALAGRTPGAVLGWKTVFVAAGFGTAYALLLAAWAGVAAGAVLLAALLALPWLAAPRPSASGPAAAPAGSQASLLAQLKNCC
jgi:hypothetical protein